MSEQPPCGSYRVHLVGTGGGGRTSWSVIDATYRPVAPIEAYLAHLEDLGRSPNTVRAYAYDLKQFWRFLTEARLAWDEISIEDFGRFVHWVRAGGSNVTLLAPASAARAPATVQRAIGAVYGLLEYHDRLGVKMNPSLHELKRQNQRYKSFLSHTATGAAVRRRAVQVHVAKKRPLVLTPAEVQLILDSCRHTRDRFLFALLYGTRIRIGQALGLRHSDVRSRDLAIRIEPRENNPNGARAKTRVAFELPLTPELVKLYSDYMHVEYGTIDSDFVFVNLWGGSIGRPLTYSAFRDIAQRLRLATGVDFTPHMLGEPEFLPVHEAQLAETRRLIATASHDGNFRLLESNERVAVSLVSIIDKLKELG